MSATTWSNSSSVSTKFERSNNVVGAYYLLMETGDNLLQETEDDIFLENVTSYQTSYTAGSAVATSWT